VAHGAAAGDLDAVPLVHQGETLGALVVARRFGAPPPVGRQALLEGLARQAAVAVAAVTLTEGLQRSRTRLLTAQEEERNRLRRDLHDGLGPQLTGIALGLDLAVGQVASLDQPTATMLDRLQGEVRVAIDDVRRIARDLRPGPLDEAGLGPALRALGATAARADLEVEVDVPDHLPTPEPRVEVAIYRIAAEALTNVVRHAGARRCTVHLRAGPDLELVVSDDGCGRPADAVEGVGLSSMRDRAEQAGGRWALESVDPHGCRVVATFPGTPT
jgi:signal transduction histidine kinase